MTETKISKENAKNRKKMAVLEGEEKRNLKRLTEEIKRQRTLLEGELDQVDIKQKRKIDRRLEELESLSKQLKMFHDMGDESGAKKVLELARIENELKVLKARGMSNETIVTAKGKAQLNRVQKEDKISSFRRAGNLIVSFFKGLYYTSNEDISDTVRATKLLKEKVKHAKTEQAKALLEASTRILEGYMMGHNYTEEQIAELTDKVIEEAKKQIQNEK